jgi:hypothetical protein
MILAPDDEDIFALLSLCDVVLSNGSNVLFEGLLLDKPGVVVTDWHHPAGGRGEFETSPRVEFPGLLNGPTEAIRALTRTALSAAFQPLAAMGASQLVRAEDRGVGAVRSVDAILQALHGRGDDTAEAGPEGAATGSSVHEPSFLREEQVRLREVLGRPSADVELNESNVGQDLVRAIAQLREYEQELRNRARALAAADEREAVARRELEVLKDQLERLRGPGQR